ncbi:BTAD domain-containing putative transcriptional regulator [Catellatospora sp. KI3]|uniref:AfsR/SARP family transcriptional regulator n=1 Tax=Catellatospora sp. KI3 TaxID=3041620 RepID=UPI00248276A6|nr:AfsR/SARP family transcriptional regulator [Catellatospora sp. KI3]MDI1464792.1 BTAD domain-containing putative transcriptional regulator [Catellatospora sp. KI3]
MTGLRFNILGPLEAWADGTRLELGGLIQKRVLAALLLEPGKLLTVSRLVEAAWDEEPPATAPHQVRKAVADLRGRLPDGRTVLATEGPGYTVAAAVPLDVTEFDALVREARLLAERGGVREALVRFREADALWRGPVLSDVGGLLVQTAALALQERRLAALERYFALRLAGGELGDLVGELRAHITRHPLQEALRGQLMLALYRAEALEEYGRLRELLAEELGVDPGPHLVKLYERILREDPELNLDVAVPERAPAPVEPSPDLGQVGPEPGGGPAPAGRQPTAVPQTLPFDVTEFVGRRAELAHLLRSARADRSRTRVIAIDGMPGAGKTSLAVRAAYLLAAEYADGQLYIDLGGFTPGERPVNIGAALEGLLRALGLPREAIPDDVVGRHLLWQSSLAGRRMLLLLDNAAETAVVSRLLPTSAGCLVLVTSRARLTELDSAECISIDVLAPEESRALLTELLGAERVEAEPVAAAELAMLCGHLPLALRIAAARLRNRRLWTVQYLVERLRDEDRKLRELSSGERGVASALWLSYQALPEPGRTAFLLLSIHPGRDIDAGSAAAMLGLAADDAEDELERLLDAHLVHQPEFARYAYHDLVGSFARGNLRQLPDGSRADAVRRLVTHYLSASGAACAVLFPGRNHRPTGVEPPAGPAPAFGDADRAQTWFGREHITLVSVVDLAVREELFQHAVFLSRDVAFYLNACGYLDEFAELARIGVAAARRLGDAGILGMSLSNLGVACWKLGRFDEGVTVAAEGLELAVRAGDQRTQAHCEGTLGLYKGLLGEFDAALAHLRAAIALEHELRTPRAAAESLTVLSALFEQWGRYPEAVEAAAQAVALIRGLSRHESALVALTDLAAARLGLGEVDGAEQCLAEARLSCDDSREAGQVALTLALSAELAHRRGDLGAAAEYAGQAAEAAERTASPLRRAKVENLLGRLLLARGDAGAALHLHTRAYETAVAVRFRVEEAYALAGMAAAAHALGDRDAAAAFGADAEAVFEALDIPRDRRRRPAAA